MVEDDSVTNLVDGILDMIFNPALIIGRVAQPVEALQPGCEKIKRE